MNELKSCPCCGDVPSLPSGDGTQYEIECDCGMAICSIQISDLMTIEERANDKFIDYRYQEKYIERAKNEAIEQWNTRHDARSELQAQRYEKLRRLNVPQFQKLFMDNVSGKGNFDDLVDALPTPPKE